MEERKEGLATYSAKVDHDVKATLQSKIEESGKTAGEFISALLATYETSQHRESVSDIRELNQLKTFLARIEEVYVSMAKSRKDVEESNAVSVSTLQEQLRAVKAELHDVKEYAKLEVEEAEQGVLEANKQRETVLAEFDKLKQDKERAEKQADAMTSTLEQQKHLIAELEKTATDAKAFADNAISELASFKSEFVLRETEIQELKNQIKFQVPADIERAKAEVLKESAQEIKTLHDKIETLQNDKLKLTESLASEREKVARLETTPKKSERKPKQEPAPK